MFCLLRCCVTEKNKNKRDNSGVIFLILPVARQNFIWMNSNLFVKMPIAVLEDDEEEEK